MSLEILIKEVLDLDGKATKGPWCHKTDDGWPIGSFSTGNSGDDGSDHSVWTKPMPGDYIGDAKDDAELIAHYRISAVRLARAARVMREALDWYSDGLYPGDESMVGNDLRSGRRAREALAKADEIAEGK